MVFWVVAGVLTFGTILLLLWPMLSAGGEDAAEREAGDEALAVYRDQLSELERDLEAGRLGEEEFEAARVEVQRRMLAASAEQGRGDGASPATIRKRRLAAAVLVIFLLPAGALLTYVGVGRPGLPDLPLAKRTDGAGTTRMAQQSQPSAQPQQPAGAAAQPGVAEMVTGLEEKLKANPEDADGWALLARSYMVTERYREAVTAYGRALAMVPDNIQLVAARGEALVLAADGMVPPAAVEDFRKVNMAQPQEPRSRYYLGLARSQAADPVGALKWWIALEADSPAEAPWRALVTQRIEEVGAEAGIDVAALRAAERANRPASAAPQISRAPVPGPTEEDVKAAGEMSAEDRSAMIQSMVDRLATRLEQEPDDLDGWVRLARAYGVLGRTGEALKAHANAARLAPDDLQIQLDYARALFPPGTPESGVTDEFAALVDHIRQIAPDSPDGLFYGGLVAATRGDAATAKELWGALLERMGPNAPARGMLERRIEALGG
jgi:cytochrome c-type biogenesis protein CcmH